MIFLQFELKKSILHDSRGYKGVEGVQQNSLIQNFENQFL